MKVRVLGCSGGIGVALNTTSILIDDDILIDAGSGLGTLSIEEMASIRHIFITHSHLDHVAFIPLLVDTIFDRIEEPIIIHAQEATLKALREHIFNWVMWPDFAELPHPDQPVLAYETLLPGDIVNIGERSFQAIPVNHVVPAVGYRVEQNGRAFAFSGDTTTNDTLWEKLNNHDNLEFLIIESAFADQDIKLCQLARHYCPSLLAEDIEKLRHKPGLYITHLKPGEEDIIMSEVRSLLKDWDVEQLKGGEEFEI
ncbi:MAG: 3',5'-cyclic-nucleotide phosphodiesterase [Gammaproteobacteria bacterium]|nr:MAG: 3',5'-cyclic-nucleotide phosphodiesterase [Gammaproteobacteria bacterium]